MTSRAAKNATFCWNPNNEKLKNDSKCEKLVVNSSQKGYTRGALIATTFQLLCSGSEKRQHFGSTFDRYNKNWIFAHPPRFSYQ